MTYPANIPGPLRAGYDINSDNNIVRSSLTGGRATQIVNYKFIPVYVDVSWLFTATEANIFSDWTKVIGCDWFTINLRTPLGYYEHECRFMESPQGPQLVGVDLWAYKGKLEMRSRPILDLSYGEFLPSVILMSDIFDKAMNREWAE